MTRARSATVWVGRAMAGDTMPLMEVLSVAVAEAEEAGGAAGDDGSGFDVAGDDRAGPDQRPLADRHPGQDHRPAADRSATLHQRGDQLPVRLRLDFTVLGRGSWVAVVGEHHAMA